MTKGATTIWEHWDNIKPDGTFWSSNMNSFNHYAYDSVADFLHEKVAGIRVDESKLGFKNIIFQPFVVKGCTLDHACASIQTKYGKVISRWEIKKDKITYTFTVPQKATADIYLSKAYHVGPGEYSYTEEL